jgi:hypothetical protein
MGERGGKREKEIGGFDQNREITEGRRGEGTGRERAE